MSGLHLLKRKISAYTGMDQCLGVFATTEEADAARRNYIATMESGEISDPWSGQAYRVVSLDADISLVSDLPVEGVSEATTEVYVVSEIAEGFGQTIRQFVAICGSRELATKRIAQIDDEDSDFPEYGHVEAFELGVLRWSPQNR